ncbi:MAG: hypothetical protein WCX32_02905 [Clostridia bacterium]|nr:hypothetical protein [Clostridia bacterium]
MSLSEATKKIFDSLGQLVAFVLIVLFAVTTANANWTFITDTNILGYISLGLYYGPMTLVSIVGLEFASTKGFLVKLVTYVALAAIIIAQFFPSTFSSIISNFGL